MIFHYYFRMLKSGCIIKNICIGNIKTRVISMNEVQTIRILSSLWLVSMKYVPRFEKNLKSITILCYYCYLVLLIDSINFLGLQGHYLVFSALILNMSCHLICNSDRKVKVDCTVLIFLLFIFSFRN